MSKLLMYRGMRWDSFFELSSVLFALIITFFRELRNKLVQLLGLVIITVLALGNLAQANPDENAFGLETFTPPAYSPSPGTVNIPIGLRSFTITFSSGEFFRTVVGKTIKIMRYHDDATIVTYNLIDGNTCIPANNTLTYSFDFRFTDFSYKTKFYILIDEGAFIKCDDSSPFAGIIDKDFWTFTIEKDPADDEMAPAINFSVSQEPEAGAENVERFISSLTARFTKQVYSVAGKKVEIRRNNNDEADVIYTLGASGFLSQVYTISDETTYELSADTEYYVWIESGAFVDQFGNSFEEFNGKTGNVWTFTTRLLNTFAPEVEEFFPYSGTIDFPNFPYELYIQFDKSAWPVENTDGKIKIFEVGNAESIMEYNISDVLGNGSDNIYLYIENPFEPETEYYITIDANAIRNVDGFTYNGITTPDGWTFTTRSLDAEYGMITSFLPARGEVGVDKSITYLKLFSNVEIYSEEGIIILKRYDDNSVVKSWVVDDEMEYGYDEDLGRYYVLFPITTDLDDNTQYYIDNKFNADGEYEPGLLGYSLEISGRENSYKLLPWDKDFWTFTTGAPDTQAPGVVTLSPQNGATGVLFDPTLVITFDEEVVINRDASKKVKFYFSFNDSLVGEVASTNEALLYQDDDLTKVYIKVHPNVVTQYFRLGVSYYVIFDEGLISDLSDNVANVIRAKGDWEFAIQTSEAAFQVYTGFSPALGAENVSTGIGQLVITHDRELIEKIGGFIRLKKSDGTLIKEWNIESEEVVLEGNNAKITNVPALENNITYFVEHVGIGDAFIGSVNWGAFLGENDFRFLQWRNDANFWRFTTAPALAITTLSPSNGATGINLNERTFVIEFNRHVFSTEAGVFQFRRVSDDLLDGASWFFPTNATFEGNKVTITRPEMSFGFYDREYYLDIIEAIKDEDGNIFPNLGKDTWRFTTITEEEANRPLVVSFTPENNTLSLKLMPFELYVKFDRNIEVDIDVEDAITIYKKSDNSVFQTFSEGQFGLFESDKVWIGIQKPFEPSTEYYIHIGDNVVRKAGSASFYQGISDNTTWSFTTESVQDAFADYQSFSPEQGATNVSIDLNQLMITFNGEVFFSPNNPLRLKKTSNGSVVKEWSWDNRDVDYNSPDNIVHTFTGFTLEPSTEYYVEHKLSGVNAVFVTSEYSLTGWEDDFWTFATEGEGDTQSPELVSLLPENNATDVSVNTSLEITFDEDVQVVEVLGSDNVFYLYVEGATENWESFPHNSDQIVVAGNKITITPSQPFDYNTTYLFESEAGSIKDLAGNAAARIEENQFRFTTEAAPDTQAPLIVSVVPGQGATNVSVNPTFVITFNEPIVPNESGFPFVRLLIFPDIIEQVLLSNTDLVQITDNQITVQFSQPLAYETTYLFAISSGMVKDLSGNANVVNSNTSFTTEARDILAPSLVSQVPANNATGVHFDPRLELVFDENVVINRNADLKFRIFDTNDAQVAEIPSTSDAQVFQGDDLRKVTILIHPNTGFQYLNLNSTYYVTMDAALLQDFAGNSAEILTSKEDWQFTIQSSQQAYQVYTGFFPERGATDVNINLESLTLTHDRPILSRGPGLFRLKSSNGTTIKEWQVESEEIVINGNAVSITNVPQLNFETTYFIEHVGPSATFGATMNWGSFFGENNFRFLQWRQDANFWRFTTESAPIVDTQGPQIVSFSPINGASDVNINSSLVIEFDEPVRIPVNGATKQIILWSNGSNVPLMLNNPEIVTIQDRFVTINYPLAPGTNYYITMADDILEDFAGNWFTGGWFTNDVWSFTTEKLSQTITFDLIQDIDFSELTGNLVLTATSTSGLAISYTVEGPAILENGNELRITGTGTVTVRATQPGNQTYLPAETVEVIFNVFDSSKENQTISFNVISNKTYGDSAFDLTVAATSELPVSLEVTQGAALVTLNGKNVIIRGAGNVTIRATQSGDDLFNPAEAVSRSFVISKADLTITAQDATRVWGEVNPLFTYNIEGFVYEDNERDLVGTVELTTPANEQSAVGTYPIVVSGVSSPNYSIELVSGQLTINKASQQITFAAIPDKTFGDEPFSISASTNAGLPVSFTVVGPASFDNGLITLTGAGLVTVSASQSGDDRFEAAVSVERTFDVAKAAQIVSITPIPDKSVTDKPFEVEATSTSGLPLTFEIVSGPASINDNTITLSGATGNVIVKVSQLGNNDYLAASATESFAVRDASKVDQSITVSAVTDKTFGDAPFTLNAIASSGLPVVFSYVSGPVTLNGNEVTITGAGTAVISTNQDGDDTFNPAEEVVITIIIRKATQTITIEPIADKKTTDVPFDVLATVSSDLPLTYDISGPATIAGNTITLTGTVGIVTVTVSQSGNANYEAATASTSFEVILETRQSQVITFETISTKTFGDASFDLTVSSSSGLPVSLTGSGPISINGTSVTILGAGQAVITASQNGNDEFAPASSVTRIFTINKASQVITFTAISDKTYGDAAFALAATSSSGLPISYVVESGPVTTAAGQVIINGVGEATITASQSGDNNYEAAQSVTRSFVINTASLLITADNKSMTFGTSIPSLTYTITGFVNGENESVLTSEVEISTSATSSSNAGTYPITLSGGAAENYTITLQNGTLTINKAMASVTLSNLAQIADGTAKEVTVTTNPVGLNFIVTYNGNSSAPSAPGSYAVLVTINEINYEGTVSGTLVINPAPLGIGTDQISISIFPNPVVKDLTIKSAQYMQVRLIDMNGRVMEMVTGTDEIQLDMSAYASGMYLIQVSDNDKQLKTIRVKKD